MPGKAKSKKVAKDIPAELRGAIDQIEGDIVVVVFDDEQRLDWPRRFVPERGQIRRCRDRARSFRLMTRTGRAQARPRARSRWASRPFSGRARSPPGRSRLSIAIDAEDTLRAKNACAGWWMIFSRR